MFIFNVYFKPTQLKLLIRGAGILNLHVHT
jgi:hypothetical protein